MPTVKLTATYVAKLKSNGARIDYFDASLPGFSLRVSEHGRKTWCVMYRFGGKFQRYTLGGFPVIPLAEARKKAKDALHAVANGENPALKKKADRNADLFDYLAAEYLARHAKPKKKSWKEDQRIIDTDLIPKFGGRRAKDISRRDVRELLDRKAAGAPIMANRLRALLRKIFNWGISQDIVEDNPVFLVPMPASAKQRERVLTESEIKKVWKALDSEREGDKAHRRGRMTSAAVLKMALLTAQRSGEIMGMSWGELDLENNWWTIPGTRTKNKLDHRVPLTPAALKIVEEMKHLVKKPSEFVFPGPRLSAPITTLKKSIARVKEKSGVHDFVPHDFRRTAATQMTSMKIQRLTVRRILNHLEADVTGVYDRHSYDSEKCEALELWNKKLTVLVSDLREVPAEA